MKVLVDTCVWSKVLRVHSPDPALSGLLHDLVLDNRIVLMGPILQEVLSGIRDKAVFDELSDKFAAFDDLALTREIYTRAAEYCNICKAHGVNGGHIDYLICAAVAHYDCALLTIDADFKLFAKYLPIKLANRPDTAGAPLLSHLPASLVRWKKRKP